MVTGLHISRAILTMDKMYPKDPDPRNWRTIEGAHVHLTNGKIDGGAGGKFSGHTWTGREKHSFIGPKLPGQMEGSPVNGWKEPTEPKSPKPNTPKPTKPALPKPKKTKALKTTNQIYNEKKTQEFLEAIKFAKECRRKRRTGIAYREACNSIAIKFNVFKNIDDCYEAAIMRDYMAARIVRYEDQRKGKITDIKKMITNYHTLYQKGYSAPTVTPGEKSTDGYTALYRQAETAMIPINRPVKATKPRTDREIIRTIAGKNQPGGSCSSAAFAYIGCLGGLDVRDFRGGDSKDLFAQNYNIDKIANLKGVKSIVKHGTTKREIAKELLKLKEGKLYYVAAGSHAAIIRRHGQKKPPEFLELQSKEINGWKTLTTLNFNKTLEERIGSRLCDRFDVNEIGGNHLAIIDVDTLKNNLEFQTLLGYINTNKGNEHKGPGGGIV